MNGKTLVNLENSNEFHAQTDNVSLVEGEVEECNIAVKGFKEKSLQYQRASMFDRRLVVLPAAQSFSDDTVDGVERRDTNHVQDDRQKASPQ